MRNRTEDFIEPSRLKSTPNRNSAIRLRYLERRSIGVSCLMTLLPDGLRSYSLERYAFRYGIISLFGVYFNGGSSSSLLE